jgi:hypothetical protein
MNLNDEITELLNIQSVLHSRLKSASSNGYKFHTKSLTKEFNQVSYEIRRLQKETPYFRFHRTKRNQATSLVSKVTYVEQV